MKTWAYTIFILALAGQAWAADVQLAWTGHVNATEYRIYQSVDAGATWAQVGDDIPQPDPFPADAEIQATVQDVPEDTLVLFRASAFRGAIEQITTEKGAWYDHRLTPVSATALGAP